MPSINLFSRTWEEYDAIRAREIVNPQADATWKYYNIDGLKLTVFPPFHTRYEESVRARS